MNLIGEFQESKKQHGLQCPFPQGPAYGSASVLFRPFSKIKLKIYSWPQLSIIHLKLHVNFLEKDEQKQVSHFRRKNGYSQQELSLKSWMEQWNPGPDLRRQQHIKRQLGWGQPGNTPVPSRPGCGDPTALGTTVNVALRPLKKTPLGSVIIFSMKR